MVYHMTGNMNSYNRGCIRPGQFRTWGACKVVPNQTTIVNNNFYGQQHCKSSGGGFWNILGGIGIFGMMFGGLMNVFGFGKQQVQEQPMYSQFRNTTECDCKGKDGVDVDDSKLKAMEEKQSAMEKSINELKKQSDVFRFMDGLNDCLELEGDYKDGKYILKQPGEDDFETEDFEAFKAEALNRKNGKKTEPTGTAPTALTEGSGVDKEDGAGSTTETGTTAPANKKEYGVGQDPATIELEHKVSHGDTWQNLAKLYFNCSDADKDAFAKALKAAQGNIDKKATELPNPMKIPTTLTVNGKTFNRGAHEQQTVADADKNKTNWADGKDGRPSYKPQTSTVQFDIVSGKYFVIDKATRERIDDKLYDSKDAAIAAFPKDE